MLEITILKTHHRGEEEARKLLPYIQCCDVFGIESPLCTQQKAEEKEKEWTKILQQDMSTDEFIRAFDKTSKGKKDTKAEEQKYLYLRKTYEQLFVERKPLWHSERWIIPPSSSQSTIRQKAELIRARDRQIAENLASAEQILRKTYERLQEKPVINLTLTVGALHTPESYLPNYTSTPILLYTQREKVTNVKWMYNWVLGEKK